jgi:hypothetical protein
MRVTPIVETGFMPPSSPAPPTVIRIDTLWGRQGVSSENTELLLLTSPATDLIVRLEAQADRMSEPVAKTRLRNATQRGGACLSAPSGAAGCLRLKGAAAGRKVQIPIEIAATPSPSSRGFLLQRLADAGPVRVAESVPTGVRNPTRKQTPKAISQRTFCRQRPVRYVVTTWRSMISIQFLLFRLIR